MNLWSRLGICLKSSCQNKDYYSRTGAQNTTFSQSNTLLSWLASATALLLTALTQSNGDLLIPKGRGPFGVSIQNFELIDNARPDPWNTSHSRKLMVSQFDPVSAHQCEPVLIPYMTPVTAHVESTIHTGYPPDLWSRFQLQLCQVEKSCGGKSWHDWSEQKQKPPVIVFEPGGGTSRLFYSLLPQELASQGFTVITIDHPYEADIVDFLDGDVILRDPGIKYPTGPNDTDAFPLFARMLDIRADDISFVLDTFNLTEVGATGHSFGGAATATAMRKDSRIKGGLNLDGAMFGTVVNSGLDGSIDRSYVLWGSTDHNTTSPYKFDWGWSGFWDAISQEGIWKREFTVDGSMHSGYWDLNVLVDVAGLPRDLPGPRLGSVNGTRMWQILGTYLSAYFRYVLGVSPEDDLLNYPDVQFPEVEILRR